MTPHEDEPIEATISISVVVIIAVIVLIVTVCVGFMNPPHQPDSPHPITTVEQPK